MRIVVKTRRRREINRFRRWMSVKLLELEVRWSSLEGRDSAKNKHGGGVHARSYLEPTTLEVLAVFGERVRSPKRRAPTPK